MGLNLHGTVSLDGSGFEAGLHKLGHKAREFGSELRQVALQAFGIYSVEAMLHKTFETAEELVSTSKRLGVGVEQLQVLKKAASENSTELEKVAGAFEKINVAREKALSGSPLGQKLLARFGALGISQADLQSKSAQDLFLGPISQAAKTRSAEDVGPILKDILGKGAGQLIPVLQTDFGELEKKLRDMGAIMSTETAVSLKLMSEEASMLSQIIVAQLGPAMLWLAEQTYKAGGKIASAASFWGAGTARFQGTDWLKAGALASPLGALFAGPILRDLGKKFDAGAAVAAFSQTEQEWQKPLEAMKKKLAEEAERLRHPAKPTFSPDEVPEKLKKLGELKAGDDLIRVGNFLGASRAPLEVLAERQISLLQQIADNTRPGDSAGTTASGDGLDFPTD